MSPSVEASAALAAEVPAVLVVDDEPKIRALLEALLRNMGFGVALAADGTQAVEVYRCRPGAFALVLVDLHMPRMDGPATLAALRRIDPAVRCCLMSGSPAELDEVASLPGVTGLLEKPFGPDLFEVTVRKAMVG
jgi:CheY-like chemotaxis protein